MTNVAATRYCCSGALRDVTLWRWCQQAVTGDGATDFDGNIEALPAALRDERLREA